MRGSFVFPLLNSLQGIISETQLFVNSNEGITTKLISSLNIHGIAFAVNISTDYP